MRRELSGDRLRLELMKRGLDQQTFARLSGISPTTIGAACAGHTINPSTFAKIVSTLARTPELLGAAALLDAEAAVTA
jgi:transcriptional regulator with XRE-family HTH domain